MNTMEFVMRTDLASALPATLDFNFEEMKVALADSLELYKGLVVTEDTIKAAKLDRASLNNLRNAVEDKRKDVKKACMAPYTDFEVKVKELVALIDQPITAIDGQLKAFEELRREKRRGEVEAFFAEIVGDLVDIVPISLLWREEWYNATTTMKKIKEEIGGRLERIRADLLAIDTVESEFMEPVKLKYLETLDVTAALDERARLQAKAEKLRQYEAERQKAQQEAAEVACKPFPAGSIPSSDISQTPWGAETERAHSEPVYPLTFECHVTKAQAIELSGWLKARNISYRRI